MSVPALAERTGLPAGDLEKIEAGLKRATAEDLQLLTMALKIKPAKVYENIPADATPRVNQPGSV